MQIRSVATRIWQEWMKPVLVLLLIVGSFRSAIADWNTVPTGSMKPTILEGDRIFVNKVAYDLKIPFTMVRLAHWGDPKRGELVVLFSPTDGKRLVKRVVGMPGDLLELRDNFLYVNGRKISYTNLDPKYIDEIPAEEQPLHRFRSENFLESAHPVMFTPILPAVRSFDPITVPESHYFVMGDNRDNSFDSRNFGPVHRNLIVGRATAVVASLNPEHHYLPRTNRFFTSLP